MTMICIKNVGGSIIKNATIKDKGDSEFVQELQSLGVNRDVALVITFLKDQNERYLKDIEKATILSQPEVSKVMQTLRERDWLTEHYIKSNGKGRPFKIYALKATIDEIINYYEMEKNRESTKAIESIQRLKELSSVN